MKGIDMQGDSDFPENDTPHIVTIKKYANRRLYNTAKSTYVKLEDLAEMVQGGTDFIVLDAKTGVDITRSVLTQIIVEQEAKGNNLLPIAFLRQLIALYGDNLQGFVPQYLEMTMQAFVRNQEQMRKYLKNTFGSMAPFTPSEGVDQKNMAVFEKAISIIAPFNSGPSEAEVPEQSANSAADRDIAGLQANLSEMQRQLDSLSSEKDS
ncbi:MAG: polyhydroxyalkanoate synthesis repressor PhaR [Pseudomonadota bacterium]|nr:polyhydroxyalkanoate synthesis repressor PhaR [Pseudomonadota bacterium]